MKTKQLFFAGLFLLTSQQLFAQKGTFHVAHTFHIQSAGGWDYLAVSPVNNNLYVAHGTQVNILDKTTGDSVGVIANATGAHGIAFVPPTGKGFVSNGKLNTLTVFDITTNQPTGTIVTGDSPDAMVYDPFSKKLFVCNGHSKNITVVDPATNKVLETIVVGGKPETIVTDEKGKLFVNIEDKSEIVVLNATTNKVLNHWKLTKGEEPTGLAIDLKNNRLFAGCGNKTMEVVDASNGKLVAAVAIGDECDGLSYDPQTQNIFAPAGEGNLTIIKQLGANQYKTIQTLKTAKGARTITFDPATHKVYIPTGDQQVQTAAEKAAHTKPATIPGTFRVMVVE